MVAVQVQKVSIAIFVGRLLTVGVPVQYRYQEYVVSIPYKRQIIANNMHA